MITIQHVLSICYKKIAQFHQKCSLMRDCSLFRRLLLPEYTVNLKNGGKMKILWSRQSSRFQSSNFKSNFRNRFYRISLDNLLYRTLSILTYLDEETIWRFSNFIYWLCLYFGKKWGYYSREELYMGGHYSRKYGMHFSSIEIKRILITTTNSRSKTFWNTLNLK